ncbi:alpha-taxilin [Toxorhynchites rutilus septentrionalis]|uniref:alpha-taxilin n=1 Tax=Toxorhynchites rutilus septentrionalis TaxID=329112 RepID=UPI00247A34B3|nr:alpha-taxilin [Toxorhynchites rutilus septentrionalis]XP_055639282.1 alpha-taxilin [Toxorhynchites rutilus septentrionalis]XP_055639283.1 alpha-taxilin [Toxorhynchites rutilus septentrionalis]XP_055639284.1 alpha-taxilin [Toxorhynchites rutilus septentrionalis]
MEVANNGDRHPAELKKQMREDKQREAKIQEQLTKQLNGLSLEEKFNLVYKRLVEAEKENKRLVTLHKQYERSMEASKKERENMILEHSKVSMTKTKLEQLCRELQKQNRMIKDESLAKIKEEEEKRKETQAKFQKSLNEIQVVMNENNDKNMQLKEDNMEMAKKFKFILEQYELRDQQMDKMNKQMDLVTQLNEAKLAKATMEASAEKEKFLAEKEIIITELTKVKRQLADLQMVEVNLREQVNMYSDKYGEFQDSLKKSHNIFVGYKGDMEKMSKKIKTLEKETCTWKSKWEKSNSALLDLMSEKQVRDEHIMKTARQLFQLQKLCRTLQNERTAYFGALKSNNIEVPEIVEVPCKMPEPEPLPVPAKKEDDRLEVMTKSCSALKDNLAALQGQLSAIQSQESGPASNDTSSDLSQSNRKKKDKKGKSSTVSQKPATEEIGTEENSINLSTSDSADSKGDESKTVSAEDIPTEDISDAPEKTTETSSTVAT